MKPTVLSVLFAVLFASSAFARAARGNGLTYLEVGGP